MKITIDQLRRIIKEEVARSMTGIPRTMQQEVEDIDEEIVEYLEGVFGGPVDLEAMTLTHLDDDTVQLTTRSGKSKEVTVYDMEQVHGVALSQLEFFVDAHDGTIQ